MKKFSEKVVIRVAVQREAPREGDESHSHSGIGIGGIGYVFTKVTAEDLTLTDAELGERYLGPAVRQAIREMDALNAQEPRTISSTNPA